MLILIMIRMDGRTRPRKASANQKRSRWARTDQRTNWNRLIQTCHGPSLVINRRHVIHGSMCGRKCHQHHQRRQTNPPIRTLEIQLDVSHWRNESHMISRNHIQIVHGKMLTQSELQSYLRDMRLVLISFLCPKMTRLFRKKTERYPGEWRNEKRGLGGRSRDEWIEKEKARGEISYAQAAGAVKQEKPAYNQPSLRNRLLFFWFVDRSTNETIVKRIKVDQNGLSKWFKIKIFKNLFHPVRDQFHEHQAKQLKASLTVRFYFRI